MKIVLSAAVMLFMVACSDDTKQRAHTPVKEAAVKVEVPKAQAPAAVEKAAEAKETKVTEALQEAPKADAVAAQAQEVAPVQVDAAALYQVCAGCHGIDGSKAALGKSQIIKGWDAKKAADALKGYKNGTYGGNMKGLMGAQVSKFGDAEIEALAQHISKL